MQSALLQESKFSGKQKTNIEWWIDLLRNGGFTLVKSHFEWTQHDQTGFSVLILVWIIPRRNWLSKWLGGSLEVKQAVQTNLASIYIYT